MNVLGRQNVPSAPLSAGGEEQDEEQKTGVEEGNSPQISLGSSSDSRDALVVPERGQRVKEIRMKPRVTVKILTVDDGVLYGGRGGKRKMSSVTTSLNTRSILGEIILSLILDMIVVSSSSKIFLWQQISN